MMAIVGIRISGKTVRVFLLRPSNQPSFPLFLVRVPPDHPEGLKAFGSASTADGSGWPRPVSRAAWLEFIR